MADEAGREWRDLNEWVDWIRKSHGLPATVIAPLWHRHDEMVWELSAQHLSFRASYHRDAQPNAPAAWRRDFWDAQQRAPRSGSSPTAPRTSSSSSPRTSVSAENARRVPPRDHTPCRRLHIHSPVGRPRQTGASQSTVPIVRHPAV